MHMVRSLTLAIAFTAIARTARNVLYEPSVMGNRPRWCQYSSSSVRPLLGCGFDDNLHGKCKFHLSTHAVQCVTATLLLQFTVLQHFLTGPSARYAPVLRASVCLLRM